MELEELRKIWTGHDTMATDATVAPQLLKEASVSKIQSLLSDQKWTAIFELAVTIIGINYLLGYLSDHSELRFLIPGLALLALGVYDIFWKVRVLSLISRINYSAPITETQESVNRLKYYEVREVNELYLVIPVFWMAFVVVFAQGLFGIDAYDFIAVNWPYQMIGSVVVAIVVVWIVRLFPDRKLDQAIQFLEEIEEFKKEK